MTSAGRLHASIHQKLDTLGDTGRQLYVVFLRGIGCAQHGGLVAQLVVLCALHIMMQQL